MKQKFMSSSLNSILKYNSKYTDEDIEKLKYGLEGLYLTFTKLVVILFFGIIFKILPQVICVLILFNIIRFTGFGFHAEKSWHCLIFSTFNFICIPMLLFNINMTTHLFLIIGIICTILILIHAPADTIKRPLPNRKKRLIRKIITVSISLIYVILGLFINHEIFRDILLSALIIQVIIISPLTYKLFKQPYNNYKNYQKA